MLPFIAILLIGLLAMLVLLGFSVLESRNNRVTLTVRQSFDCPFVGRAVTARLQQSVWGGAPTDVVECSAFDPATAITCGKPCLQIVTS